MIRHLLALIWNRSRTNLLLMMEILRGLPRARWRSPPSAAGAGAPTTSRSAIPCRTSGRRASAATRSSGSAKKTSLGCSTSPPAAAQAERRRRARHAAGDGHAGATCRRWRRSGPGRQHAVSGWRAGRAPESADADTIRGEHRHRRLPEGLRHRHDARPLVRASSDDGAAYTPDGRSNRADGSRRCSATPIRSAGPCRSIAIPKRRSGARRSAPRPVMRVVGVWMPQYVTENPFKGSSAGAGTSCSWLTPEPPAEDPFLPVCGQDPRGRHAGVRGDARWRRLQSVATDWYVEHRLRAALRPEATRVDPALGAGVIWPASCC